MATSLKSITTVYYTERANSMLDLNWTELATYTTELSSTSSDPETNKPL